MDFSNILDKFKEKKILVVGDIMLDKHIYGSVSRISPEAPVPVLKAEKEVFNPGGAANLASNLSSLGAKVYLAGTVGNDDAQKILFNELHKIGIDSTCIIKTNKPTIQKVRGLSKQHLFRIDYEDNSKISGEYEVMLLGLIKSKIHDVDAVILSDYAKGTLTENVVKEIISLVKLNRKLITADCKPINFNFYKNVDLLKPNKIFDVSGAGDTVLATLTLAWISGASLKEATELSSNAAAIVIEKPGVVAISLDELKSSLICSVKIVPKVWGQEQWLVNNEKYCGKKMLIKDGYYCSYHKHKIKDETRS